MNEITKEQMLEYFDGILNRLDYEYTRTPLFKQMTAAIESLIESSGESAKPNIVVSDERVEIVGLVLKDIKTVLTREGRWAFVEAIGDAITVIDAYSSLRAENERLRAEFSTLKKAYDDECAWRGRGYRDLLTRAEKAEAELARGEKP
jgi:hypothetical protein